MGKIKMPKFMKDTQKFVSKNAPAILTGIGIAGMVTTTVLAVKATPKAIDLLKEKGSCDDQKRTAAKFSWHFGCDVSECSNSYSWVNPVGI